MHPLRTIEATILFLGALLVRLVWMPTWSRLVFEGHEALYRDAFLGMSVRASTQAYPLLTGLYAGMGRLTDDPRFLVVFSAIVGASAVVAAAIWVGRLVSPGAGLWTGILVALLPEHAAWSTSAYNVILPHALLMWAFVVPRWWRMILVALAASMRMELVLLAPLVGWPGMLGGLAVFVWDLPTPQLDDFVLAWDLNWAMFGYLGPAVLFLGLLSLRNPQGRQLIGVALWVHLVGAAFEDYGARHALLGGVALCGAVAATRTWSKGVLPVFATLWLAVSTGYTASGWNGPDTQAVALDAAGLGAPDAECEEVTEEPWVGGQALPSHIRFFRGEIDAPCVIWGEEFWHRTWSSRGLADRAKRMRVLYKTEPIGALHPVRGGPVRLYHRLERRW